MNYARSPLLTEEREERIKKTKKKKNDMAYLFFFFLLIGVILQWAYYIEALSFMEKNFGPYLKNKKALS